MTKNIFRNFVLVSLVIHLAILFSQNPFDLKKGLSYQDGQKLEDEKSNKKMKILISKNRQIVQTQDSSNSKIVEKSFLGKKDNFFERQTVSKVIDTFRVSNGKSLTENNKITQPQKNSTKLQNGKLQLSNLGLGIPVLIGKNDSKSNKKNQEADSKDKSLLRDVSALASASNDKVDDVPLSDISRLNTTEYKHYGFFQRIRSQLEQHWGTTLKEKAKKIYKSGRNISSDSDFITNIEVELDKNGKITNIFIIGTSGVKELDDAAVESFNKAGPFPNPPSDLLSEGTAKIKWGFVVKS